MNGDMIRKQRNTLIRKAKRLKEMAEDLEHVAMELKDEASWTAILDGVESKKALAEFFGPTPPKFLLFEGSRYLQNSYNPSESTAVYTKVDRFPYPQEFAVKGERYGK